MKTWQELIEELFGYRHQIKEMPEKALDLMQDRFKYEKRGITLENKNEVLKRK